MIKSYEGIGSRVITVFVIDLHKSRNIGSRQSVQRFGLDTNKLFGSSAVFSLFSSLFL